MKSRIHADFYKYTAERIMCFIIWGLITSWALGAEAADLSSVPDVESMYQEPIPGLLALENAMSAMGAKVADLEMIHARFSPGTDAPWKAKAERRDQKWNQLFGHGRLTVKRQRMADNVVIAQEQSVRKNESPKRPMCATADANDTREITLSTYPDLRSTPQPSDLTPVEATGRLFYLNTSETRTAVTHLNPGESITVVELVGPKKNKQPRRQIKVKRKTETFSITESEDEQTICLSSTEQ